MTTGQKIVVIGLGVAAAFAFSRRAMAETVAGQSAGEAKPAIRNDVPQAGIVALVTAINEREFGGWHDVADVMAIIEIESSFDANAYRAEPQINDGSRGLMQILLMSAKDRGFGGNPAELFNPEVNLRFGMAHLKWGWDYLAQRRGADFANENYIGAYNAGVGNAMKGYTPLGYVAKFALARAKWKGRIYG